ncbi:hypothetical protein NW063_04360 [Mycoplasmopsis cynos]|uniref:hypothetical protein n=1 Tax=Mycoplasmopsis cynos TaxID=171284 RepID=UPI002207070F|nr:hypothetical protein [Mycoplasmopsis cynos]UWV86042.1 hypothetical protein NW063_04360 [Mycoplasmopsis cynos]
MSEYKIFSVVAGSYEVHNTKTNEISFLKGAGKLRYHKVSLLVGDNVKIKDGLIIDVIKRHNSLIRQSRKYWSSNNIYVNTRPRI